MKVNKQHNEKLHEAATIPLDRRVQYITSSTIVKWLREFLKKDLADLNHCSNCGGILPELMFIFEGREYWFTCFKINENGKKIAETDYAKFCRYCKNSS